jgi:hypothetical protein
MAKQYHNDVDQLAPISEYNFENIFSIHQDGDFYFYNILKTINFPEDMSDSYYTKYRVKSNTPYTSLSFKFYNTIKLWWLIVLANNINNPVQFVKPGNTLKIIRPEFIPQVLAAIESQLK